MVIAGDTSSDWGAANAGSSDFMAAKYVEVLMDRRESGETCRGCHDHSKKPIGE